LDLSFDPKEFNYSHKWLYGFKKAFGINRMRLHGEGADADMNSVATARRELPPILADTPLSKIYNFDETGLSLPHTAQAHLIHYIECVLPLSLKACSTA
jgi:hypothetical protein